MSHGFVARRTGRPEAARRSGVAGAASLLGLILIACIAGCAGRTQGPRTGSPILRPRALAGPPYGPHVPSADDGRILSRRPISFGEIVREVAPEHARQAREILEHVRIDAITYRSDGLRVNGYLARPRDDAFGSGPHPCVVFNRGGNRETGALTDAHAVLRLGRLARYGYVVVGSQYRGNAGSEGHEEFGGADVRDVLNLIPLLESLPEADASRIGMYGWSRGGMMTYLALARTDRIAAAIVGAGVADAIAAARDRPDLAERVLPEIVPDWHDPVKRDRALADRSAVLWPERLCKRTPILLLHGSADALVKPTQGLRMADALFRVRHPFRFVFFEGGDHGLTEYADEVDRLVLEWLDRYVRDREVWPSIEPHGERPPDR